MRSPRAVRRSTRACVRPSSVSVPARRRGSRTLVAAGVRGDRRAGAGAGCVPAPVARIAARRGRAAGAPERTQPAGDPPAARRAVEPRDATSPCSHGDEESPARSPTRSTTRSRRCASWSRRSTTPIKLDAATARRRHCPRTRQGVGRAVEADRLGLRVDRGDGRLDRGSVGQRRAFGRRGAPLGGHRPQGRRRRAPHHRRMKPSARTSRRRRSASSASARVRRRSATSSS